MKRRQVIACALGWLAGTASLMAAGGSLPALLEKPWEGYFAAVEERGFHFGIGCDGVGMLAPLNSKGEPAAHSKAIKVQFVVEELVPGGKVVAKQIDGDSLETTDKAQLNPEKLTFRGKVTGGASFEVMAEFDGSKVMLGGRVTNPGELKNPLRFAIRTQVNEVYKDLDLTDRDERKKLKDDEVKLETVAGGRGKVEMAEVTDVAKICGDKGVRSLRMEMGGYAERRFEFAASEGSAMWIDCASGKPMVDGFTIHWRPDPDKDKEGRARLTMEIR